MSFMIGKSFRRSREASAQPAWSDAALEEPLVTPAASLPQLGGGITPAMLASAEREYALCARRVAMFGLALSCEPAWNLLLDLFISAATKRPRSLSAICFGTHYSQANATRYLTLLLRAGLVSRSAGGEDGQGSFLQLTPHGRECVASLLEPQGRG